VNDDPGVTRDRQYSEVEYLDRQFLVVDTGGIEEVPVNEIEKAIYKQSEEACKEADVIYFVVDGRSGLTPVDDFIATQVRKLEKPVYVVVNKTDGLDKTAALTDFYALGFAKILPVAASQNLGIESLLEETLELFPEEEELVVEEEVPSEEQKLNPKVAIIGRPNVGKSTLMNRMLGHEQVIVCDMPGTTRDSIYIPMERHGKSYTLIDTAGVRKKKKVSDFIEKISAIKTLQAIKEANVVLLIFDARLGLSDQDLTLIDFTIRAGKGLVICANKWDGMTEDDRKEVKATLSYRLRFAKFASVHYISALHGTGVGLLFKEIDKVYQSAMLPFSTSHLTKLLENAIEANPPPLVKSRRIKLRYAHCGGHNPPTIVIHGNQTDNIPQTYQKYLSNFFLKALNLSGTPVKVVCKSGDNPYAGKRNILTKRQIFKKQRLMKHVKKKAKS
jgi:GTP-binding protein